MSKLYVLEQNYNDHQCSKLKSIIADANKQLNETISYLQKCLNTELSAKPSSMFSAYMKEQFLERKTIITEKISSTMEELQMYREEMYARMIQFNMNRNLLNSETVAAMQPVDTVLNTNLQKVQLRLTGYFAKSLVDTLLDHNINNMESKLDADAYHQLNTVMLNAVGNYKWPLDFDLMDSYRYHYYELTKLYRVPANTNNNVSIENSSEHRGEEAPDAHESLPGIHKAHASVHSHPHSDSPNQHKNDPMENIPDFRPHSDEEIVYNYLMMLNTIEIICSQSPSYKFPSLEVNTKTLKPGGQVICLLLEKLKSWHVEDDAAYIAEVKAAQAHAKNAHISHTKHHHHHKNRKIANHSQHSKSSGQHSIPKTCDPHAKANYSHSKEGAPFNRTKCVPLLIRHVFRTLVALLNNDYVANRHTYPKFNAQYLENKELVGELENLCGDNEEDQTVLSSITNDFDSSNADDDLLLWSWHHAFDPNAQPLKKILYGELDPQANPDASETPENSSEKKSNLKPPTITQCCHDEEHLLSNITFWMLILYPRLSNIQYKNIGINTVTNDLLQYREANVHKLKEIKDSLAGGFGGKNNDRGTGDQSLWGSPPGSPSVSLVPCTPSDKAMRNNPPAKYFNNSRSSDYTFSSSVSAGGGGQAVHSHELKLLLQREKSESKSTVPVVSQSQLGMVTGFDGQSQLAGSGVGGIGDWSAISANESALTTGFGESVSMGIPLESYVAGEVVAIKAVDVFGDDDRKDDPSVVIINDASSNLGESVWSQDVTNDLLMLSKTSHMYSVDIDKHTSKMLYQCIHSQVLKASAVAPGSVVLPPSVVGLPRGYIQSQANPRRNAGVGLGNRQDKHAPLEILDFGLDLDGFASDLCVNMLQAATMVLLTASRLRCCDIVTYPIEHHKMERETGPHKEAHSGDSHNRGISPAPQANASSAKTKDRRASGPHSFASEKEKGPNALLTLPKLDGKRHHGHGHHHKHGHGHRHKHGHGRKTYRIPRELFRFITPEFDLKLYNNINIVTMFAAALLDRVTYHMQVVNRITTHEPSILGSILSPTIHALSSYHPMGDTSELLNPHALIPDPPPALFGPTCYEAHVAVENTILAVIRHMNAVISVGFINYDIYEMVTNLAVDVVKVTVSTSQPVLISAWLQMLVSLATVLISDIESRILILTNGPSPSPLSHGPGSVSDSSSVHGQAATDPYIPEYTVIHVPENDHMRCKEVFEKERCIKHLRFVRIHDEEIKDLPEVESETAKKQKKKTAKPVKLDTAPPKRSGADMTIPCFTDYGCSSDTQRNAPISVHPYVSSKEKLIDFLGLYVLSDVVVMIHAHKQCTSIVHYGLLLVRLVLRYPFLQSNSEVDAFINPIPSDHHDADPVPSAKTADSKSKNKMELLYAEEEVVIPPCTNLTFPLLLGYLLDTHIQCKQLTEQILLLIYHLVSFSRPTQLNFIEAKLPQSIQKILDMVSGVDMYLVALCEMCLDGLHVISDHDV